MNDYEIHFDSDGKAFTVVEETLDIKDYPYNWPLTQEAVDCWMMSRLYDRGIPLVGLVLVEKVEKGELIRAEIEPGIYKYTWKFE